MRVVGESVGIGIWWHCRLRRWLHPDFPPSFLEKIGNDQNNFMMLIMCGVRCQADGKILTRLFGENTSFFAYYLRYSRSTLDSKMVSQNGWEKNHS